MLAAGLWLCTLTTAKNVGSSATSLRYVTLPTNSFVTENQKLPIHMKGLHTYVCLGL